MLVWLWVNVVKQRKRFDVGVCTQLLLLCRSGVSVRSNLMYFTGVNWLKVKTLLSDLLDLGYISIDGDKRIFLTNKGREYLSFVDRYMDLYSKDLNKYFKYD